MQINIFHNVYGQIIYSEGFWSGKRDLIIPGHNVQRISKNNYIIDGKKAYLKGSYLFGIKLCFDDMTIILSSAPKFYEYILAFFPLLFICVWGNMPDLFKIFPIISGGIGGALAGFSAVLSLYLMRTQKTFLSKLLMGLSVFIITVAIAFLLAEIYINAVL